MTLQHTDEASPLLPLLTEEAGAISRFIDLLKREQSQLAQGATEELPALADQKTLLAEHLQGLAVQRNAWLSAQGCPPDRPGIEAWQDLHPEAETLAPAWAKIIALASEAHELNRLNGELIDLHMRHNTRALNALRGSTASLSLYGSDGQSRISNSRRIDASA